MSDEKIPRNEWPSDEQLKWQKRQADKNETPRKYYSSSCVAACKLFLENPPPGVVILPGYIVNENKIRILFGVQEPEMMIYKILSFNY